MKRPSISTTVHVVTFTLAATALYVSLRRPVPNALDLEQGPLRTRIEPGHIEVWNRERSVDIWGRAVIFRKEESSSPIFIQTGINDCGSIALQTADGNTKLLGDCTPQPQEPTATHKR